MLQELSIESILNKRYAHAKKDMNSDRTVKYLTYLMATKLEVEILAGQKWGVYTGHVIEQLEKDNMNNFVPLLAKALDDCSVQTLYLFNHWLKGTLGKNYVPSKPLLDVLTKIDVDMKASYLKEKVRGYFELSHANILPPAHWSSSTIDSVLYEINSDSLILSFQFKNDLAPTSFFIPLDREDNLHDALLKFNFKEISRARDRMLLTSTPKTGVAHVEKPIGEDDLETLKLIFNLIIYVTNPNEEFTEQFNQFSPNNRVAQLQKQTYTCSKYVPIGNNIEFLRLTTATETNVKAHWRWQPCGIGREQRKLTFIKPHVRTYEKTIGA